MKPWDDETDLKAMEDAVRSIEMDGLVWGASKLVAIGYGKVYGKFPIKCTNCDDFRYQEAPGMNHYLVSCS